MRTHSLCAALLCASVLLAACGGVRCPSGTYRQGSRCVPWRVDSGPEPDAGSIDDAGRDGGATDASADAPPDAAFDGSQDAEAGVLPEAGAPDAEVDPCSVCPSERPLCGGDRCVECTAEDESRCGDRGCNVEAGVCVASLCEPCTTDAQCSAGLACVVEIDADGGRCVWREDAPLPGPAGSCLAGGRPFVQPRDATTVDGASVRVCLLGPSTCAAWLVYRMECTSDADCGVAAIDDGSCVDGDSGPTVVLRCTTPCASDVDCPAHVACERERGVCAL